MHADKAGILLAIEKEPKAAIHRLAYADWLEEHESGPDSELEIKIQRSIAYWIQRPEGDVIAALRDKHKAAIRRIASARGWRVIVLSANPQSRPHRVGKPGYSTFAGSTTVPRAPGAARKAGHKLEYHTSTAKVAVGLDWLVRQYYLPQR